MEKNNAKSFFILSLFLCVPCLLAQNLPFNKVILWGHKLHSHTHSYIHYAFYKAFKHLGYEAYWFDNNDNVHNFNFRNSLFITEGQVDGKMPLREDCRYILHNCDWKKYEHLFKKGLCIKLQVYTHACLQKNVQKIEDFVYADISDPCLYMPWATDLLPHEIDQIKKQLPNVKRGNYIYFIGSWQGDVFSNEGEYNALRRACKEQNIEFKQSMKISPEQNVTLIQRSYMAPAIQGKWQCEVGYIPCRIFKNISYGQPGITNSKTVYDLFQRKIVYNSDCYKLFYDAQEYIKKMTLQDLYAQMDFVKEKHTYLNRIHCLLDFLHAVKPILGYTN